MNPLEGHTYIELPPLPSGPIDDAALEELSEKVVEAYSSYRFTTNVNHIEIIKRYPVKLRPRDAPQESIPTAANIVDSPAAELMAAPANEVETPKPCFLHNRPKTSGCARCSQYLEWKKSTRTVGSEASVPKKPRL